ncbi:hypothetical protein TWF730_009684 [Orbilia blumenaviensis]|uniref:Nephrocystin 3-like N-terminal domain-containing protein n=1 Tax=Orbilia blumenaviensis TaxID=1796055 RepID=A0AAV9UTA7_9PEZI
MGMARAEATITTSSMLEEIQIRPFSSISRRLTFQTADPLRIDDNDDKTPESHKSLVQCFEEARETFDKSIVTPLIKNDPKRSAAIKEFLRGAELEDLGKVCRELSEQAEDKTNNKASKLLMTLDQFKGAGDALLQFAPESVSIVWFGISSLITIGNAKVQTRLMICGACDSIANIVADCVRWESMAALMISEDQSLDIWDSDVPNLIFLILEFLWTARPHFDQSRLKRIASNLKEVFSKELEDRVNAILEKYETLAKAMQGLFQESVLHGSFKTGQMLEQIRKNLQNYVSIGVNLLTDFQKRAFLDELDKQQSKLEHPASYKLHFSTLNDRLNKIIHDRDGKLVANWLFSEEKYCGWKTPRADSSQQGLNFLCLRGPRGHGKSVAMMCIHRDIVKTTIISKESVSRPPSQTPFVCHFFFKKGEQNIERTRSALESILYQLLGSDEIRRDINVLIAAVSILSPSFGEVGSGTLIDGARGSGNFQESLKSLCDTIKAIAATIQVPVYLMIDALDECIDRREQCFLEHLKSLVNIPDVDDAMQTSDGISNTESKNLKLIISVRDSVDIVGELATSKMTEATENNLPKGIKIVDITSERNSSDLREYLIHAAGEVLARRISRMQYEAYYDSQLSRIVKIVHGKANGDFTLARLIIANLQQPSRDTLEKRIKRLPSAIGEIYKASLEALTADEQEFVVAVLKWVVWSVSGLSVLEISDHYKDIYKLGSKVSSSLADGDADMKLSRINDNEDPERDLGQRSAEGADYEGDIFDRGGSEREPDYTNPFDDPEVKDTIYHIENAGRDFFRYDRNTGVVNVDISIREWIQQDNIDPGSPVGDSRGFNKFRDSHGNTVFQFTLAPLFVRYGDTLSHLFDKKEAHMSIALAIFRTLNNDEFQDKYMPWKPDWTGGASAFGPRKTLRYEIEHWPDHIRALQEWWTEESLTSSWWTELLAELSIFTRPENWYRWNIQRPDLSLNSERYDQHWHIGDARGFATGFDPSPGAELFWLFFQEPIHFASSMGLPLLIDVLVRQMRISTPAAVSGGKPMSNPTHIRKIKNFRDAKVEVLFQEHCRRGDYSQYGGSMLELSYDIALAKLVQEMGHQELLERLETLTSRLAPNAPAVADERPSRVSPVVLVQHLTENEVWPSDKAKLRVKRKAIFTLVNEVTSSQGTLEAYEILCNSVNILGRPPLCIANSNPIIIKQLLKYGANINNYNGPSRVGDSIVPPLYREPPLKFVLLRASEARAQDEKQLANLLRTAELLILGGAGLALDESYLAPLTCIHLAALIQDFKLFRLLCVSGDWNINMQDDQGRTPLHCLFAGRRPTDRERVEEIISIFKVMLKMKTEEDLINVEDEAGRNVLALAVGGGFIEAVEVLVSMGVDVLDEDKLGSNCFHHLATPCDGSNGSLGRPSVDVPFMKLSRADLDHQNDLNIADVLIRAGLDYTKPNYAGETPLYTAVKTGKWLLARYLLKKYDELALESLANGTANPLLSSTLLDKTTLFHALIQGAHNRAIFISPLTKEHSEAVEFLNELNGILSKYTDTKKLMIQGDNNGNTPLHWAIDQNPRLLVRLNSMNWVAKLISLEIFQAIIAVNPEVAFAYNHSLECALDSVIWNVAVTVEGISYGHRDYEKNLVYLARVLKYFWLHLQEGLVTPKFPFAFLFGSISLNIGGDHSGDSQKLISRFGIAEILDQYDAVCKARYGWHLSEYTSIMSFGLRKSHRYAWHGRDFSSPASGFARPTKIGWTSVPMKLSTNMLRALQIEPKPWYYQFGISDNPIPPMDTGFYFEVKFSSKPSEFSEDGVFCEFGLKSPSSTAPEVTCDIFDGLVSVTGRSYIEWQDYVHYKSRADSKGVEKKNPFTDSKSLCFGCGVNPVRQVAFFTVDGAIAYTGIPIDQSIFYPFFGFTNYTGECKLNFGAERFMFEVANFDGWEMDWRGRPLDTDKDTSRLRIRFRERRCRTTEIIKSLAV